MNVGWLRKLLHRLPRDMEVYIMVDGKMHQLCGKVDLTLLTFHTLDEPDIDKGEQALVVRPCTCEQEEINEEEDKMLLN